MIFEGKIKDKSFLQAQSEYQASKDITYCRGRFVPVIAGKWECEKTGKKIRCLRNYKCKSASKKNNRRTLSLAAKRKMKNNKEIKSGFHIGFHTLETEKKAEVKTVKKEEIKKEEIKNTVAFQKKKEPLQRQQKDDSLQRQEDDFDGEVLELVPSLEEVQKAKGKETKVKGHIEDVPQREVEDIETNWVAKGKTSPDGIPVYRKVVERSSLREEIYLSPTHGKLKNFTVSAIKISNDTGSFQTLNGAWSPYFQFNAKYALKANLSSHFIRVTSIYRDLNFLVFALELHGVYYFENRLFIELGGGRQYWQNDENNSYDVFTLGGGYKFYRHLFFGVDKIFASVGLVQNDQDNLELKVGLGLSY